MESHSSLRHYCMQCNIRFPTGASLLNHTSRHAEESRCSVKLERINLAKTVGSNRLQKCESSPAPNGLAEPWIDQLFTKAMQSKTKKRRTMTGFLRLGCNPKKPRNAIENGQWAGKGTAEKESGSEDPAGKVPDELRSESALDATAKDSLNSSEAGTAATDGIKDSSNACSTPVMANVAELPLEEPSSVASKDPKVPDALTVVQELPAEKPCVTTGGESDNGVSWTIAASPGANGKAGICPVCNEKTLTNYDLLKHLEEHCAEVEETGFKCKNQRCKKTFKTRRNLIRHYDQSAHAWPCRDCHFVYMSRKSLVTHEKSQHLVQWKQREEVLAKKKSSERPVTAAHGTPWVPGIVTNGVGTVMVDNVANGAVKLPEERCANISGVVSTADGVESSRSPVLNNIPFDMENLMVGSTFRIGSNGITYEKARPNMVDGDQRFPSQPFPPFHLNLNGEGVAITYSTVPAGDELKMTVPLQSVLTHYASGGDPIVPLTMQFAEDVALNKESVTPPVPDVNVAKSPALDVNKVPGNPQLTENLNRAQQMRQLPRENVARYNLTHVATYDSMRQLPLSLQQVMQNQRGPRPPVPIVVNQLANRQWMLPPPNVQHPPRVPATVAQMSQQNYQHAQPPVRMPPGGNPNLLPRWVQQGPQRVHAVVPQPQMPTTPIIMRQQMQPRMNPNIESTRSILQEKLRTSGTGTKDWNVNFVAKNGDSSRTVITPAPVSLLQKGYPVPASGAQNRQPVGNLLPSNVMYPRGTVSSVHLQNSYNNIAHNVKCSACQLVVCSKQGLHFHRQFCKAIRMCRKCHNVFASALQLEEHDKVCSISSIMSATSLLTGMADKNRREITCNNPLLLHQLSARIEDGLDSASGSPSTLPLATASNPSNMATLQISHAASTAQTVNVQLQQPSTNVQHPAKVESQTVPDQTRQTVELVSGEDNDKVVETCVGDGVPSLPASLEVAVCDVVVDSGRKERGDELGSPCDIQSEEESSGLKIVDVMTVAKEVDEMDVDQAGSLQSECEKNGPSSEDPGGSSQIERLSGVEEKGILFPVVEGEVPAEDGVFKPVVDELTVADKESQSGNLSGQNDVGVCCGDPQSCVINLCDEPEEMSPPSEPSGVPFVCNVCNSSFPSSVNLADHLVSHQGAVQRKCILCPKMFETKSALLRHFRTHLRSCQKEHKPAKISKRASLGGICLPSNDKHIVKLGDCSRNEKWLIPVISEDILRSNGAYFDILSEMGVTNFITLDDLQNRIRIGLTMPALNPKDPETESR